MVNSAHCTQEVRQDLCMCGSLYIMPRNKRGVCRRKKLKDAFWYNHVLRAIRQLCLTHQISPVLITFLSLPLASTLGFERTMVVTSMVYYVQHAIKLKKDLVIVCIDNASIVEGFTPPP